MVVWEFFCLLRAGIVGTGCIKFCIPLRVPHKPWSQLPGPVCAIYALAALYWMIVQPTASEADNTC